MWYIKIMHRAVYTYTSSPTSPPPPTSYAFSTNSHKNILQKDCDGLDKDIITHKEWNWNSFKVACVSCRYIYVLKM